MKAILARLAALAAVTLLMQLGTLPARAASIPKAFRRVRVNSSRVYLDHFMHEAASSVPTGALVLDAGAGQGPYRHHFSHARYESVDIRQVENEHGPIKYVCDLTNIPVENDRYDLVACTQVLQYAPEPKALLTEVHRVLKPGGELWLSAPLFYEEERAAPPDLFRYTKYGLRYLLAATGFEVRRIDWLEGYFGTLSYELDVARKVLPRHPRHYGGGVLGVVSAGTVFLLRPLIALLSLLFSRLDLHRRYSIRGHGHCKNYAVVAVKSLDSS